MSEPGTIGALFKWTTAGVGAGITYAVAAVETNPNAQAMVPDLDKSVTALVIAVVAYVLRAYMPSEKKVDGQFVSLTERLIEYANESKSNAKEFQNHSREQAMWMGGVNEKLDTVDRRLDTIERYIKPGSTP